MAYRTIIVDDEPPALAKLSYLLKDYEEFELVGSFSNANDVLDSMHDLKPQAAFLDIAMPGRNGMELASILQSRLSDAVKIVFVTAYDQYAVSAFDIDATDYLMKPVSKERFQKSILRLKNALKNDSLNAVPVTASPAPMVRAFGKLEITDTSVPQPEWRTAKVRELFALFLQNRPTGIFRKTLLETLWNDLSEDKALSNLNTCNYYLRKFLQKTETDISLKYKSGYYSLDLGSVFCDSDIFEQAETMALSLSAENIEHVLYGASLYRGKYFEDVKCGWANLLRDQYDIRYANLRVTLAAYYAALGQLEESNAQAAMALDIDPLCENAWKTLLTNYHLSANKTHYETTLLNRQAAYQDRGLPVPELG
jgi:two-component SAPR family response regulator